MNDEINENYGEPTGEPMEVMVRPEPMAVGKVTQLTSQAPITAAQAKIEAVASLTTSAYARAAMLELTPEESARLQADFPDEAFQTGAAGKENLIYIEHAHLRDRFNSVFGMGKWAIVPRNRWGEDFQFTNKYNKTVKATRIYVEAMLIVRGCFVGEAVGAMEYYTENNAQNYGDAVEGAKTAAFRRCAKEFGVGLQAWKKEWCEGWWKRRRTPNNAPAAPTAAPKPPVATTPPPTDKNSPESSHGATPAMRDRMVKLLEPVARAATEYFQKMGLIMPGESLSDVSLTFVPTTKEQMDALMDAIQVFADGDQIKHGAKVAPTPQAELPDSRQRVTGTLDRVSIKEGKNKKGHPWKLYGICVSGTWANSFDHKIGELAEANKGANVTMFVEETERGMNCLEIQIREVTP